MRNFYYYLFVQLTMRSTSVYLLALYFHYNRIFLRLHDPLVEHLHLKFGEKLTILTTGHSLGGGLAQHAAYCSEHISIDHAFAPTPVTGYFSVPKAEREKNKKNTIIVRSFEHGEILAFLRFFMRRLVMLSAVNPEINELRFNASSLPPVTSHSMSRMAEHLRRCLKEARALSQPNIARVLADTSSKSISNKSDSSQKDRDKFVVEFRAWDLHSPVSFTSRRGE